MLNLIDIMPSKKRALSKWLPCLVCTVTLAGAASARQAPGADDSVNGSVDGNVSGKHAASRTTYRVINLARNYHTPGVINDSGQVGFAMAQGADDPLRPYFYDGRRVRDLGTLGGDFGRVTGLNDQGQVTGISRNAAGDIRSFFWSERRGMIDIGVLPGATATWEPAINNRGEITGYSTGEPRPYPHAFRWTFSSGMEDLGGLTSGADAISYGRALNDDGMIVGFSLTPANDYHAFAWTRATGMVDIDSFGSRYSEAVGVSASGQVVGSYRLNDRTRAFIWTRRDGMRDIGAAGGNSYAYSITAGGRMTGSISPAAGVSYGMTWTRATGLVTLATFGGAFSSAIGANDRGQVVGVATTAGNASRAFVWTAQEGMVDLNTRLRNAPAGLILETGWAISDKGSIVALSNAGLVLLVPSRVCGCHHTVGPIAAADLVKVGAPLDASVSFAGEDRAARHHVIWNWGDGSGDHAGATTVRDGNGSATGSHAFASPGMYTVSARVTDLAGNSVTVSRKVIAYDRSRGFAGGAGSFLSPQLPNIMAPLQAGLARFSFIVPVGTAANNQGAVGQLELQAGALNFHSKQVRATGTRGEFAGSGTINGAGDYRFSMASRAGSGNGAGKGEGAASISLRIWRKDPRTGAELVAYDSQGSGNRTAQAAVVTGAIVLQ